MDISKTSRRPVAKQVTVHKSAGYSKPHGKYARQHAVSIRARAAVRPGHSAASVPISDLPFVVSIGTYMYTLHSAQTLGTSAMPSVSLNHLTHLTHT